MSLSQSIESSKRPLVLCILDGWGEGPDHPFNGITRAHTPFWDHVRQTYPLSLLNASGAAVGLPWGQMGNSEVGHLTIGAGRVLYQDLVRIDRALADGTFKDNPALCRLDEWVMDDGSGICHVLALLSPGGVHSHERHIWALVDHLLNRGIGVRLHGILDGRDTPPKSARSSIQETMGRFSNHPDFSFATLSGRYYAMDRDRRFDRTAQFYHTIVAGQKRRQVNTYTDPLTALEDYYQTGGSDEFMPPCCHVSYDGIGSKDGFIAGNFRADRMRQIMSALVCPTFDGFDREGGPIVRHAVTMTSYSEAIDSLCPNLFPPQNIPDHLGAVISDAGLTQLRLAETEKYAHVTFFLNGGSEIPLPGEDRFLIPSPPVATYDLAPSMSAHALTDYAIDDLQKGAHDVIIMNYANGDMVGHTGHFAPAVAAVECIDDCLKKLAKAVFAVNGLMIITADHGNVEEMYDPTHHMPHTAHTLNPVPFLVVGPGTEKWTLHGNGTLADVAPTILHLLGLPMPTSMTGQVLIDPT